MNVFDKLIFEMKKECDPSVVLTTFLSTPLTAENINDIYITLYNLLYNAELISDWHDKYSHAQFVNSNINVALNMLANSNGKINDVCSSLLGNKDFLNQLVKDIIETKYHNSEIVEQINNSENNSLMRLTVDKYTDQQFCNQLYFQKLTTLIKEYAANVPLLSKLCLPTFQKHGIDQVVSAMYKFMISNDDDPKRANMFTSVSRGEVESYGKDVVFNEIIKSSIRLEHTHRIKQNGNQSSEPQRALFSLVYDNARTNMLDALIPCIKNSPQYLKEFIRITISNSINNQSLTYTDQKLTNLLQYVDSLNTDYKK